MTISDGNTSSTNCALGREVVSYRRQPATSSEKKLGGISMNKLIAAVVSTLALASGCAGPAAPTNGNAQTVATTEKATSSAHERAVVKLTNAAAAKLKEFLAAEPTKHIRLSVKSGGTTGFMYDMQIDQTINDTDLIDRSHGFTLVVDPRSSLFLEGATLDWQTQSDGQAGFKFENPNAVSQ